MVKKARPASVSTVTTLMFRAPLLLQLHALLVVLMPPLLQHLLHQVTHKQHGMHSCHIVHIVLIKTSLTRLQACPCIAQSCFVNFMPVQHLLIGI